MKIRVLNLFVVFTLLFHSTVLNANGLGINLNLVERGGTYVDVIKEHHRWLDPDTWQSLSSEDFDNKGWPIVDALLMMDERLVAEWASEVDDPDEYRLNLGGVYKGSFLGSADISSTGDTEIQNVIYDSISNTTFFEWVAPEQTGSGYGFFTISFTNTILSAESELGSGIKDLRLFRPGYDLDTDQTFVDPFLEVLQNTGFAVIRYKDFTGTDGCDPEFPAELTWQERKLPDDASQRHIEVIGKNTGAAWEYVIKLANKLNIDPWINIPVSADSEYIDSLALMFKENLNPNLNIYLESSNEVWNTAPGYGQSKYNQAQAQSLGIGEHENHGRRTIEIAKAFEETFGEGSLNNKVRVILCSHFPMLKWWVEPMVEYLENNYGNLNQYVYAISCQSYFSGGATEGESVDKILADCRASITEQINEAVSGRKKWVAKANEFNLKGGFCFYEGGPDHGGGSTVNLDNRIRAERDEGMAEVFKYNYDEGFFQLGGNIAIQFTLTSAYTRYGCWGLTDDINNPYRNYKFQAAKDLIAITDVKQSTIPIITNYRLVGNYPNPFNPSTTISYSVPEQSNVTLKVFDGLGKEVAILVNEVKSQGNYKVQFDAGNLTSGVYYYQLRGGNFVETKKMVLLK